MPFGAALCFSSAGNSFMPEHSHAVSRGELPTTDKGCGLCNVFMKRDRNRLRVVYEKTSRGNVIRVTPQKYFRKLIDMS